MGGLKWLYISTGDYIRVDSFLPTAAVYPYMSLRRYNVPYQIVPNMVLV